MGDNHFKDLTGQKFGEWTVLEYRGNGMWLCQCSCEDKTLRIKRGSDLKSGKSKSCGCKSNKFKDLTGQMFGDWLVIEYLGNRKWMCQCQCEKKTLRMVSSYDLTSGKSKSCGHNTTGFKDLTGKIFGNLKVLEYEGNQRWTCECLCDNHTIVSVKTYHLTSGQVKSCGCLKSVLYRQTMLDKYGDTSSTRIKNKRDPIKIQMVSSAENLANAIRKEFKDKPNLMELSKFLDLSIANTSLILHKFNMTDFIKIESSKSYMEDEIVEYIQSLKPEIRISQHNRSILSGQELDIYLPEYNLAIEFNGTYWHSSIYKDIKYHQNKSIACAKQRIRLIHIFEHEWKNETKKNILKNMIKSIICPELNLRIYGVRTDVKHVSTDEAREFLNKHHLQGYSPASIQLGLYYDSTLIGMMTFGRPRFSKEFDYELIRLAWVPGISVVGGSEKLFKHFISEYNPESIISYCDLSKFIGQVYYKLKFKPYKDFVTKPNYYWINLTSGESLTRYQTMKQSLIDKGYGDLGDTEDEIMSALDYAKVYDSGNLRFVYNRGN